MAVLIPQSREELRVNIGEEYGGLELHTATSAGTTSTFVDAELENTDDYINGRYWRGTSGTNDGVTRFVDDYVGSTKTGTVRGDALAALVADGDTYELWDGDVDPRAVDRAINRAVQSIPRKGAPPLRDVSLHTSSTINTYTIPTAVSGISQIQIRTNHKEKVIHNADSLWTEQGTVGSVTSTLDSEFKREGSGSNKHVLAAGLAAGTIIASEAISSLDLSSMTHAEFWITSTVATTAGDLELLLDDTAACASPVETLSVPALVADTPKFVRVALANPGLDTAIISVGLKHTNDIGAATVHIDGVRATTDDTGDWVTIHRNAWSVDKDARTFSIHKVNAPQGVDYALIKLLGVKKPTELDADATECDIEPEYIVYRSIAILLRSRGDRRGGNRDAAFLEADRYEALALNALSNSSTPSGVVWIDN
jgi:hypothetical protein